MFPATGKPLRGLGLGLFALGCWVFSFWGFAFLGFEAEPENSVTLEARRISEEGRRLLQLHRLVPCSHVSLSGKFVVRNMMAVKSIPFGELKRLAF